MATLLGSLLVSLGMESTKFRKGLTDAERAMKATQQKFDKLGTKIADVGKVFSVGITAPVLAAGAAFAATANKMAQDSREMATAAQVAGEGFEQFQRQAFAARSVGIEFDKLGDQFKDVRERIGEFVTTGGGPLQDAFDALNGKVRLTIDELRGLSGKDALQLVYDRMEQAGLSGEEMSFVLESLASDTTALIPLLKDGGKAFEELGKNATVISDEDRAKFDEYVAAQERLGEATKQLTIAFVSSGLLDAMVSVVQTVADFAAKASELSPELVRVGVAVAAVGAALGPVIAVVGNLVSAFGVLLPLLTKIPAAFAAIRVAALALMANPVILGFAAVLTGIYLAWQYWDEITAIVRRLYTGVKTWLQDKLGAIFDWVGRKIGQVTQFFEDMYIAVVGNSYVPDMVREIGVEMAQLDALMVSPARSAANGVIAAMSDMASETGAILNRLFPEFAKLAQYRADLAAIDASDLSDTLKDEARRRAGRDLRGVDLASRERPDVSVDQGPLVEASRVEQAAEKISEAMQEQVKKARVQTVQIAKSFQDMANDTIRALDDMVNSIRGGGFLDILGSVLNLGLQLGSIGAFGSTIANNINRPRVPGFANGTNFAPGGLALVGERGPELVNLRRGSQVIPNHELRGMAGAKLQVEVVANNNGFGAMVRDQAGRVVAQAAPTLIAAGSQAAQVSIAQRNSRRVGAG